ncbi:MAG: serine/threonine-protein kinase [Polyangiaceae bacterium]
MLPGLPDLQVGFVFGGDFEIVRPLASGGMGAVYVARQRSTGRERALKVMLGHLLADADLRRRFEQEARVGAEIESEHVVEVVGAGVDAATGVPWMAMEFLPGESLAAHLERVGALPWQDVETIFLQLCHAVGAAHDKRIIHRDLKPDNVLLAVSRRPVTRFNVKVLDFGLAKVLGEIQASHTRAIGTPLWMAPEQAEPGAKLTPAVDVWALGLIAFRALTGKNFWRAAQLAEVSPLMVLRETGLDPIPLATTRCTELGGHPLPAGFDAWLARCLDRAWDARFRDANEAFAALRPLLRATVAPTVIDVASRPAPPAPCSRDDAVPAKSSPPPVAAVTEEAPPAPAAFDAFSSAPRAPARSARPDGVRGFETVPCPVCGQHVFASDAECIHCRSPIGRSSSSPWAAYSPSGSKPRR